MIKDLKRDSKLRVEYLDNLMLRVTMSSLELEGENGNLSSANQALKILCQENALKYAMNHNNLTYNHYDFFKTICDINSRITNGEINDFRKTSAEVLGSSIKRTPAPLIRNELLYLIDDHNYHMQRFMFSRNEDDLFYLEALFHMKFLHIHPFEDGNGRTIRVLLFKHLLYNDYAPAVITKEAKKLYCNLIENNKVDELAKLFKHLSDIEKQNMEVLYNQLNQNKKLVLRR